MSESEKPKTNSKEEYTKGGYIEEAFEIAKNYNTDILISELGTPPIPKSRKLTQKEIPSKENPPIH